MGFPPIDGSTPPNGTQSPGSPPPCPGLLLVRSSRQRKSLTPPDQASPPSKASSLKLVARFVNTLDRQAWQFSGGYAQPAGKHLREAPMTENIDAKARVTAHGLIQGYIR